MLSTLQPQYNQRIILKEQQIEIMEEGDHEEDSLNLSIDETQNENFSSQPIIIENIIRHGVQQQQQLQQQSTAVTDNGDSFPTNKTIDLTIKHEKRPREENVVIEENTSVTASNLQASNGHVEGVGITVNVSKKSRISLGTNEEEELDVDAIDEINDYEVNRTQQEEDSGKVSLGTQESSEEEEEVTKILQQESEDVEIDDQDDVTTSRSTISSFRDNVVAMEASVQDRITEVSTKQETVNGWASLSPELWYQVFSFQNFIIRDLYSCIQVCKEWKSSLDTSNAWGQVLRHSWRLCKSPLRCLEYSGNEYNWKEVAKKYFLIEKEFSTARLVNRIDTTYATMGSLISRRTPGSQGPVEELANQLAIIQRVSNIQQVITSFEQSIPVHVSLSPCSLLEELLFVVNNTFFKDSTLGTSKMSILSKGGEEIQLIAQQASNTICQISFVEPLSNSHRQIFQLPTDNFSAIDRNVESLQKALQLTYLSGSNLLFYLWKYCVPVVCNFTEDRAKQLCEQLRWNLQSMDIFQEPPSRQSILPEQQNYLLDENQSTTTTPVTRSTPVEPVAISLSTTEEAEELEEDIDIL